jgi:hypothetical protein
MNKYLRYCLIVYVVSLLPLSAFSQQENLIYRPFGKIVGLKAYEIAINTSLFNSTSRIDHNGIEQPFTDLEDFYLQEGKFNLRYGMGEKLELRIGARARGVFNTTVVGEQIQNLGLDSVYAGAKYALDKSPGSLWDYAVDLQFRQTSHSNADFLPGNAPIDVVILGDSGNEITAGMYISRKYGDVTHFNFYTAFNMPANSQSQEVLYDAQFAFAWSKWALIFGVDGIYSLKTDDFFEDAISKPAVSSGSTFLFNSINRQYAAPYLMLNKAFTKWRIGFKARTIALGVSTDIGLEMGLEVTWNSRGVTDADMKVSSFKEYEIEATVIKISPRSKFVKIDHGLSHDVEKGARFDIFQSDYFGGNVLIASGLVYQVGSDWAIIKLLKRYKDIKIKKGFVARGY